MKAMATDPCKALQAFLDDFEKFHHLRQQVLDMGIDVYDSSTEVKSAHADLAKRLPLVRDLSERAGVAETEIDLKFNDNIADTTREALLRALGAYQHGLVSKKRRVASSPDATSSWRERVEKSPLGYAFVLLALGFSAGWAAHKYLAPLVEQPSSHQAQPATWGP